MLPSALSRPVYIQSLTRLSSAGLGRLLQSHVFRPRGPGAWGAHRGEEGRALRMKVELLRDDRLPGGEGMAVAGWSSNRFNQTGYTRDAIVAVGYRSSFVRHVSLRYKIRTCTSKRGSPSLAHKYADREVKNLKKVVACYACMRCALRTPTRPAMQHFCFLHPMSYPIS